MTELDEALKRIRNVIELRALGDMSHKEAIDTINAEMGNLEAMNTAKHGAGNDQEHHANFVIATFRLEIDSLLSEGKGSRHEFERHQSAVREVLTP